MVDATVQPSEVVATDDGIPLKVKLARATRRQKIRALMLVAPLGLFVLITFIYPIAVMLTRSVHSPELGQILHRTTAAMEQWNGEGVPGEDVFEQFAVDMKEAGKAKTLGKVATRFNFEVTGTRSLFFKTNRKIKRIEEGPWKEAFVKIDKKWEDPGDLGCHGAADDPMAIGVLRQRIRPAHHGRRQYPGLARRPPDLSAVVLAHSDHQWVW